MAQPFTIVGKSTPKLDGRDKVTGRTRYLHDLELPRLAHGKILRTRLPHARIVRLDASRARARAGVLAVVTGADVQQQSLRLRQGPARPETRQGRCIRDEVAAVAAETPEIAEEALELIDVEYDELPAVFDPVKALEPARRWFTTSSRRTAIISATSSRTATWTGRWPGGRGGRGHVPAGLRDAGLHGHEWSRSRLGPVRQLDDVDDDPGAVPLQRDLGEALGIGGDRIRVLQPAVGGNFGRGLDLYPIDVIAALLARAARRPVKIEFDRVEEFLACPTREACAIRLRTAADRDGRLLARDAHVDDRRRRLHLLGSTTPYVMLSTVAGLYRVPNVRFDTTIALHEQPLLGLDARLR